MEKKQIILRKEKNTYVDALAVGSICCEESMGVERPDK